MTRSEATVSVACVRPTLSTVETRPWNMRTPPTTVPIGAGEKDPVAVDRSTIKSAVANGDEERRAVDYDPSAVAAIVICCLSTSRPTLPLYLRPEHQRPVGRER